MNFHFNFNSDCAVYLLTSKEFPKQYTASTITSSDQDLIGISRISNIIEKEGRLMYKKNLLNVFIVKTITVSIET